MLSAILYGLRVSLYVGVASGAIALLFLGLVAEWRWHARRAAQLAAALAGP